MAMSGINRVFAILFSTSLLFFLSMWAWILFEGFILKSSDPNIGAGILMFLGGFLTLLFGLAWGVSALISLIAKRQGQKH